MTRSPGRVPPRGQGVSFATPSPPRPVARRLLRGVLAARSRARQRSVEPAAAHRRRRDHGVRLDDRPLRDGQHPRPAGARDPRLPRPGAALHVALRDSAPHRAGRRPPDAGLCVDPGLAGECRSRRLRRPPVDRRPIYARRQDGLRRSTTSNTRGTSTRACAPRSPISRAGTTR